MKNIFAFAKFGDKFRTRDGRMAIFQIDTILDEEGKDIGKLAYVYTLQDGEYSVALNGIGTSGDDIVLNNVNIEELNDDIVSEWREEIAEEELEDIAIDEGHELSRKYGYDNSLEDENIFIDGFKEGYRKAKIKKYEKIMFNDKYGLTRAVLEGRKTQTRRIAKIKDIVPNICHFPRTYPHAKYKIGEEVAVAQAYKNIESELPVQISDNEFEQKQAYHIYGDIAGWSNKMFVRADLMPHRIKITNIRVEMLQDISNDDCLKEGIGRRGDTPLEFFVYGEDDVLHDTPQRAFSALIDNVSGKGTWESNPYVFVYDFELIR